MSSILKALEKVEESHARRNAGASGLVRARERRAAWVVPAWALGGATVAALATFAVMGGFSRPAAPVAQQVDAAAKPAPVVVSPLVPGAEAPGAQPEEAGPNQAAEVFAVPIPKVLPAPHPTSPPKKAVPVAAVAVTRPAPVHSSAAQAAPAMAIPVSEETPQAIEEKPRQEIRVTGIAWQKDSASSLAMVNGRPVREGALVDGFKLEEILEDSVRFSGSNGKLTIPLGGGE